MARLEAEFAAGAPQPDVLLIADMVTMEGLEAEGRLLAYPEADVSAYDPAIMDDEGHYFSTKLITTGIVYNTAAPFVPESWADLMRPEAQGQIAMPSPLTSGAATIHMEALTGHPDLGWAYYEGLAEQGTNPQGGNGGKAPTRREAMAASTAPWPGVSRCSAWSSTSCRSGKFPTAHRSVSFSRPKAFLR